MSYREAGVERDKCYCMYYSVDDLLYSTQYTEQNNRDLLYSTQYAEQNNRDLLYSTQYAEQNNRSD